MVKNLVSIVIPVYNSEKYISETINSILNQTYSKYEIIIVDDGSTDRSEFIIKEYLKQESRIKYYKQVNSGPACARNYGVEKAEGQFICFIDADDLWQSNKLETQVEFMKDKNCAFSYHSYEFADEYGNPKGQKVLAKEKLTYKMALKNNIISTITVMFNIELIDKELIKMPDINYVEDTATWWRILRHGYIAYGIKDLFSFYRKVPSSHSSNKFKTQKYLWQLYREEESLTIINALYCLLWKNFHALLRRI